MQLKPPTPPVSQTPWRAELDLRFETRAEKTVLAGRSHRGPLAVQRAFYPEGGVPHIYILHPPGGAVGGDELAIRVECAAGARALLTTPAAGKFYRSAGGLTRQTIDLKIGQGAELEWLPQENILFDGAQVDVGLRVDLADGARFIGWDMACLGRPASGEEFASGSGRFRLRIERAGKPLSLENFLADPLCARANWGLRGHPVTAALWAYPCTGTHLAAVRETIENLDDCGATLLDDLLVLRALGRRTETLRRVFVDVWRRLRPETLNRPACPPRIWAT